MFLNDSVSVVKGVGDEVSRKFGILGIHSLLELIEHYPRRYEDYSAVVPISATRPGPVTVRARIKQSTGRYVRRGMHITEAVVSDDTGSMRLIWFNQPYRSDSLKVGQEYYISGIYELSHQRMQIMNPSVELVSDFPINTARIIPIYKETKGLTSKQIRKTIGRCIEMISALPESLPDWLVKKYKLMAHADAVRAMHFPESAEHLAAAQRRLGFEEVFQLTLASLLNKQELGHDEALRIEFKEKLAQKFVGELPFTLTDAQKKVIWQILLDMQSDHPMNRLVEGDVGSGKTVVATMAALMVVAQGNQVAFMAPTELLARQHAETIFSLLEPLGMHAQVTLLVGGLVNDRKLKAQQAIKLGQARFIIGTQALIQDKVHMPGLALVIVDEQHRFGVDQRKALMAKAGHMPHLLSLTATPIPRSLALTLYGELSISIIDAKPANRKPIRTVICSPNSRPQLYETIKKELDNGRQMFVVCPLISESDVLDVNSAEKIFEELSKKYFKQYRVGLLHGKMKAAEKNTIMADYVDHKLDILVSTTVIEVGVDVPNASIMLIEAAERFGLAQIHQLRGRVGRSDKQGFCYLMMSDSKPPTRRLRALESSQDGFKLAEFDLEIRGPGAIYGQSQHGQLDLRVAKLSDVKLIALARQASQEFIDRNESLVQYKPLEHKVNQLRTVTNLN